MPRRRTAAPFACTLLVALMSAAWAQQPAPQRVEITGSSIKRVDAEGALPVQTLTREEIDQAGLTTAAEIVSRISAAAGNLTDGVSIAAGGYRDQMGFNAANLRGIGVSSTLVLLNGRRMANFASPGDDAGVDLNNIPAAAIDRVEVLLDGASALYGSDAIAGVINFITRRDWRGVEVGASLMKTQEGGAGKRTASIAAGFGDLARDGYNVLAVLDVQKTDRLVSSQRKFIEELDIPGRLPYLLLSRTFPANIDISDEQLATLNENGFRLPNGARLTETRFNLGWPNCNPPASLALPDGIGGPQGCTYNFMGDVELYPETDKQSLLTRGVFALGGSHQLFAEASLARARSHYVALAAPFTPDIDLSVTRVEGLSGFGLEETDPLITARLRFSEAGRQDSELVSTGTRLVAGVSGTFGAWDYEVALNHSRSKVSDRAFGGYLNEALVDEGLADGRINPFGPSSAAGLALIAQAQIRGEVRSATGTMDAVDFKFSRALAQLAGGELGWAAGGELRRENQDFRQSEALAQDLILGQTSQGPDADFSYSRRVSAVWTEFVAPLARGLELQAALRHERYQGTGSATSPKLGVRWQPEKTWLVRGSVGAGFRAPSMTDLFRPVTEFDGPLLADPVCLAAGDSINDCTDIWRVRKYSNPGLKPEKSRQLSLGMVFEPARDLNFSVDAWYVEKRNLISRIGAEVILDNEDKYGNLVVRYNEPEAEELCGFDPDDDDICYIELRNANRGRQKAAGLDLQAAWRNLPTAIGSFGVRLNGTLTLVSKEQSGNEDPYVSNLGKFVDDKVVQRWRHTVALDWELGRFGLTLANSYLSGYTDQNNAPDAVGGGRVPANRVKAYSIWDLTGSWELIPGLTLRAGVYNLADTSPPFSNQAYFYLSGYDPSYTDPRGRRVSVGLSWALK